MAKSSSVAMEGSLPIVRPVDDFDTCEFQWFFRLFPDVGSRVDPCCRRPAEVRLDLGYGEEPRCFDHALWDLAGLVLERLGTSREEFGREIPWSLKIFLRMWLKRQLSRLESEAVPARGPH